MRTRVAAAVAALVVSGIAGAIAAPEAALATTPASHPAARKAATKTTASIRDGSVVGRVTADGKGVKGLKVRIQRKAGSKWSTYATVSTQKGGAYSAQLVRTGTYRSVTLGTASYKGSTSKPVGT